MDNKLKVFTAFSGYDSQCMALDKLNIDYDLVGWPEIDKNAIQAHNAIYPAWSERNYGDISKIDWESVPDFDLFTYSFPCQDISSAGYQRGLSEGSGTRSSLLWECKRAIERKKPKYLLMENVKALTSKKFMPYLQQWLSFLHELGYTNYTKVLNAKNYGVPQNRERVFVVSILGDDEYYFPIEMKLDKLLKDVLEDNVDEKYYLSKKKLDSLVIKYGNKRVQSLVDSGKISDDEIKFIDAYNQSVSDLCGTIRTTISTSNMMFVTEPLTCAMRGRNPENPSDRTKGMPTKQRIEMGGDVANCITTVQKDSLVAEPILIGGIGEINFGKQWRQGNRVYDSNGIAACLMAQPVGNCGGNSYLYKVENNKTSSDKEPKVIYKGKELCDGDGLYLQTSLDFFRGGLNGVSRTLKASVHDAGVVDNYRIRKLTPRECFRLMGVSEENIDKIENSGVSKSQQYKLAGNSIVVDVLYHIFRKLFIDKERDNNQSELF